MILTIIYYLKWLFSYSDYYVAKRAVSWYGYHTVNSRSFRPPRGAKDLTIDIEYYFNNKRYRYITDDPNYTWPPEQSQVTFRLPVRSVFTLDEDDKPVQDVTDVYKEYSGPRGEPFPMHKVFPFDKKLKVTDIMGKSNVISLFSEEEVEVS